MPGISQNIIFDLDGTLTNPFEGIYNSLRYALKKIGYTPVPSTLPTEFIGPPLQQGFKNIFGLNPAETEQAVRCFREYYGQRGLFENHPYEGIIELLEHQAYSGRKLFVATSKLEEFAWKVITHFNIDRYITDLQGADYSGNHSKSGIIKALLEKYRLDLSDTIMVGDTVYDIEGAHEAGIKCIAVDYGFNTRETLVNAGADYYASTVGELSVLLGC